MKNLNCWKHTRLIDYDENINGVISPTNSEDNTILEDLVRQACTIGRDKMSIANFLNPEGEDECVEIPTDDNVAE